MRPAMKKRPLILALSAVLLLTGCAFLNRDNTPLLNLVEEELWPESTGARVAVFPVVFPLGFAAVLTDAVVVHPVSVVGDAIEDTGDALWDDWDWENRYMTECAVLPWRAVATPIFFGGDFLGRAMFDVPRRAEKARATAARRKALRSSLAEARSLLGAGKASEALDRALAGLAEWGASKRRDKLVVRTEELILEAAHRCGRYESLLREDLLDDLERLPGRTEELLETMQASPSSAARWAVLRICSHELRGRSRARAAFLARALRDPDPVIRHSAVDAVATRLEVGAKVQFREDLARLAERDPDAVVRAHARWVLDQLDREEE
jgi:hypothetical protein